MASLEKISTCLLVLVLVCLFICSVPWIVCFAIEITKRQTGQSDPDEHIIILWTEALFTINSTLNC